MARQFASRNTSAVRSGNASTPAEAHVRNVPAPKTHPLPDLLPYATMNPRWRSQSLLDAGA
jgi:hypothetical protein